MDRIIDHYLYEWRLSERRKPLILRGARQVGKTNAVRRFSNKFSHYVEINFELSPEAKDIFNKNLQPDRIIKELGVLSGKIIEPGKTLLFLDEIQAEPNALTALRYFYEMIPELHVIAAGSLLDFAIDKVGVPVGRVSFYHMYPLSFIEFLCALGHKVLAKEIITHPEGEEISQPLHDMALSLLGEYIAIGGMPEAVISWIKTSNLQESTLVHHEIIDTYVDDFPKYARKAQVKYVDLVFKNIPQQLGSEFKTSRVESHFRKRELAPAIELLEKARVIQKVHHTAGQGIPLAVQSHPDIHKIIMLDIALSQALLGLSLKEWILKPQDQYANKGPIIEALIGQEILAYSDPRRPANLYYWQRTERNDSAEIDYLVELNQQIIPVEVKSTKGSTLKSMRVFLESHKKSPYGIRFSTHDYSIHEGIHSYPLYSVSTALSVGKKALLALTSD